MKQKVIRKTLCSRNNNISLIDDGLKAIFKTDKRCISVGGMDFCLDFPLADEYYAVLMLHQ